MMIRVRMILVPPKSFGLGSLLSESSDGSSCLDQAQPTVTGAATVPELAQGILAPSLAPHAPALLR